MEPYATLFVGPRCGNCLVSCHRLGSNDCVTTDVTLSKYVEHLTRVHRIQESAHDNGVFTLEHRLSNADDLDANWHCMFIRFDGHEFIPRLFLRFGILHVALSIINGDAEDYWAKISFLNSARKTVCEMVIPMIPIGQSDAQIAEGWIHPVLTKRMLEDISRGNQVTAEGNLEPCLAWQTQYQVFRKNK